MDFDDFVMEGACMQVVVIGSQHSDFVTSASRVPDV